MSELRTQERTILVGVGLKSARDEEARLSLLELSELAETAGAEVVGSTIQFLDQYQPATLIGSGKVQEIKEMAEESEATLVIIDHQLSGIQGRNLTNDIGQRIIDRSQLIIDIFAQRARTFEGKLQVELALLMDQLPRMIGAWQGSLSKQGAGIGTRGPGETALELDRRKIRERMKRIQTDLEKVEKSRGQHRALRKRQRVPSFALIGYTNAGKSTLLNKLSQAEIYAKDQLFATLDPTTRKIYLPEMGEAVATDTVGFIRKLPTHLIKAFKATLEESAEADVLLHVIDASSKDRGAQMAVVEKLIEEFKWSEKPIISIFNKADLLSPAEGLSFTEGPRVLVSAENGQGIPELKRLMVEELLKFQTEVDLFFSKSEEHLIFELDRECQIQTREAATMGTRCKVFLTDQQLTKWKEYLAD